MLKFPDLLGFEVSVIRPIIDSIVGMSEFPRHVAMHLLVRDWPDVRYVILRDADSAGKNVPKYPTTYFSAQKRHSGDSSLSPNPPSSSEMKISG